MTTEDEFVARLDAAREAYITARDAADELWPRYRASLATPPLMPGQFTPEITPVDREFEAEWDRRTEAAVKAHEAYVKLLQRR